jgi:hypothetical protein
MLVGMATVLALTGVAGAATVDDLLGPVRGIVADQVRPASDGPADGVDAGPADGLVAGRQEVGHVERVERVLGYSDAARSTSFRYPGASYVKVRFARTELRPGDYVTVSNPSGTEVHRYESGGRRWAMSVTGDSAVVTLHRTAPGVARSAANGLGLQVDRVAHGFTPAEAARTAAAREPGRTGREESICGSDDKSDAVCYRSTDPVAYQRSKAVVRLLIDGAELCTGWRIGPRNRLVTNNHCFANSDAAYNTEVWFNYQCAKCGGFAVFRPTKVWGDRVLVTDRTLDVTVFTVERFPDVQKFGYLELDPRRPVSGDELFIPQHPAGDPTMIAMASDKDRAGNCAVADPTYDGYARDSDVSYYCDTEGGSSGSPVLSRRTGKVIALHHFGGCPNSGVRADLIQRRIGHTL